ncbi:hypothetical protein [Flavobacterium sp. NRK1]|uniref:hypothetical protein n=1 Tax=Flavobacterium sp. NRK1 TaxID=2954929 RepID=UPI002091EA3C|nr:hypothetical protein [Flavobacterium sp. NRK1]MCO6148743.1 hypothetical protein [Flavobacterium sp. NRK1]
MKYLYPLSLLFILASCQKEDRKAVDHSKTDWAFYKIEGNVKNISTKSWHVNENLEKEKNQYEDMSNHDNDMLFDEEGKLISEKLYLNNIPYEETTYKGKDKKQQKLQYINGKVGIKIEYDWDKSGKDNTSITRRNADNTQIDRIEMKYQGNKLAEKITYNSQNNPTDKITYLYDSKGNVNEENIYLGTEYIQYKGINKYDKKNRKISEARYDKASKKLYETISKYEGENLVKKHTVNEKGETDYSEEFTYDAKGNMITHSIFEKYDNSNTLNTYKYDDNGNKIQWEVVKNDKLFMIANYTYDSKNNTTSIIVNDNSGKEVDKREYAYDYDSNGNWIKKTIKIKNVPQFIEERQITYYD